MTDEAPMTCQWAGYDQALLSTQKRSGLLIEIHGNTTQHAALLKEVALLDYLLFALEANPLCRWCCEYSFINRNCMERYGAYILKPYLKDIVIVNQ
ncbi:unnamed protein product [Nippostrongylus brasiliensis]|uniref:DUF2156 domain-containing protein n=1 Tax=Nippostrongylus brasiliensis TaxID=27835 RepID=A0A0N4YL13_NIPBR|nr:unnamed protein product [Nippostrongylus brasiliensis]